tara:strand:- start:32 stop:784 length:753 start_codon:yes stop_codon:yes gene_type:complete
MPIENLDAYDDDILGGYREEMDKIQEHTENKIDDMVDVLPYIQKLEEENKKFKDLYVKKSKEARLWKKKYDDKFYEGLENPNYELKLYDDCIDLNNNNLEEGVVGTNELRLTMINDEYYDGNPPIMMCWDWKNKELDRFFRQHYNVYCIYDNNYYYDFKWMDFIKEKFGWEKGKILKINTKSNSDGYMNFWKQDYKNDYVDFIIDENGFILHPIYETEYFEWRKNEKNKYVILNCEYNYKLSKRLKKENE